MILRTLKTKCELTNMEKNFMEIVKKLPRLRRKKHIFDYFPFSLSTFSQQSFFLSLSCQQEAYYYFMRFANIKQSIHENVIMKCCCSESVQKIETIKFEKSKSYAC